MKKLIAGAAILIPLFSLWFYSRHPLQTTVTVRNTTFIVDVAIQAKEKEIGLGYRNSLAADHGMLFVYDHKEVFPFWMKNMRFPIDILWIEDRIIVDITKDVPPPASPAEQLPLYHPRVPVDKVLELPAGTADRVGIIIGDKIIIKS